MHQKPLLICALLFHFVETFMVEVPWRGFVLRPKISQAKSRSVCKQKTRCKISKETKKTNKQTKNKERKKETNKQTNKETNKQRKKERNKQTNRQTNTQKTTESPFTRLFSYSRIGLFFARNLWSTDSPTIRGSHLPPLRRPIWARKPP